MAKKKAAKKKAVSRKTARKKVAPKKKAAKKKAATTKKTSRKKVAKQTSTGTRKKASRAKAASPKLGRAKVPGDAKLDDFFRKDYEARQLFEFLRVHTLKELEEHSPDEIVARLTAPMLNTVNRIRKALALSNRALKDDQEFAAHFMKTFMEQRR